MRTFSPLAPLASIDARASRTEKKNPRRRARRPPPTDDSYPPNRTDDSYPQIPEEAELTWDIGDGNPESALDKVPENVLSKRGAAALLAAGLGFFVGLYHFAGYLDKASTVPFAPRTYPYDNLKEELGGHEDGGQPKC